jgi:hypothetical protein
MGGLYKWGVFLKIHHIDMIYDEGTQRNIFGVQQHSCAARSRRMRENPGQWRRVSRMFTKLVAGKPLLSKNTFIDLHTISSFAILVRRHGDVEVLKGYNSVFISLILFSTVSSTLASSLWLGASSTKPNSSQSTSGKFPADLSSRRVSLEKL